MLSAEGIKVNVTLIFTANQALLAARAGAAFVSPFLGRLDDISQPGIALIRTIMEIFGLHGIETEVIAASVRNTIHVTDCALAGADIATVPFKVLMQTANHPLTDQEIEKFQADYRKVFGEKSVWRNTYAAGTFLRLCGFLRQRIHSAGGYARLGVTLRREGYTPPGGYAPPGPSRSELRRE